MKSWPDLAPNFASKLDVRSKPPDLLIWKYPSGSKTFWFWQWKVLETFQTYRFQKSGLKEGYRKRNWFKRIHPKYGEDSDPVIDIFHNSSFRNDFDDKINSRSGFRGFPGFQTPPSKSHKLNSLTALIGLLISHPASNNPNL